MKRQLLAASTLALGLAVMANAQTGAGSTKVGVINIQAAMVNTRDGQKAAAELDSKRAPKQKEFEGKQAEIAQLRDQLNKGSNTMSADNRERLMRDIDQRTKALNRDVEDAQADFEQQQQQVLQNLGQKMMAVIDKYARDNGFSLILDVSSPQTPVLFATNQIDITQDIIKLYDAAQGTATSAAPAGGSSPAAVGAGAAARPATTPAGAAVRPPAAAKPAPAKK